MAIMLRFTANCKNRLYILKKQFLHFTIFYRHAQLKISSVKKKS